MRTSVSTPSSTNNHRLPLQKQERGTASRQNKVPTLRKGNGVGLFQHNTKAVHSCTRWEPIIGWGCQEQWDLPRTGGGGGGAVAVDAIWGMGGRGQSGEGGEGLHSQTGRAGEGRVQSGLS